MLLHVLFYLTSSPEPKDSVQYDMNPREAKKNLHIWQDENSIFSQIYTKMIIDLKMIIAVFCQSTEWPAASSMQL